MLEELKNGPLLNISKAEQIGLMLKYQSLTKEQIAEYDLADFGFRIFSQHDEDGILLFIFSIIGMGRKTYVEIGCGNGVECNTANLTLNHCWCGLLIDSDKLNIEHAMNFYSACRDSMFHPPNSIQAIVTPNNVNDLIKEYNIADEIDLLSIDIDGYDWWVWKALDSIRPRVVIVETPTIWGPEDSYTIPNNINFKFEDPDYVGASHLAYVKLGREKGYKLIGCNRYGTNSFFLRNNSVGADKFTEIDVSKCFRSHRAQYGIKTRRPRTMRKDWIKV